VLSCRVLKRRISIVGPGRLGAALALALDAAGYKVNEIVARDSPDSRRRARAVAKAVKAGTATVSTAKFDCDVVWLCVPDARIASLAAELAQRSACSRGAATRAGGEANWRGKTVFHASGALTSERLEPLAALGATVASVHPMMTFPGGTAPNLAGVSFAVEGDSKAVRVARGIVRGLKGVMVEIAAEHKRLYHAWGAFASPLIVCLLATADRIAAEVGFSENEARRTLAPILRQTIENYIARGPASAFSGPLVRGDVETVRAHLEELSRVQSAKEVYLALAKAALATLPVANREEIEPVLGAPEVSNALVPSAPGQISSARSESKPPMRIAGIIQPY
jgi:predicted short-subunit dehydrogenase-like oxidoreductase (DUF2520 family)